MNMEAKQDKSNEAQSCDLIPQSDVGSSAPFRPGNNWVMAVALRDGVTCRIPSKHMAVVLTALDYHNIRAVIEQEDDEFMLVIPHCC